MKNTRRPDGKPETVADTRFFNLRGSGWSGPIDQDGNAVMSRTDNQGRPLDLAAQARAERAEREN